MCCDIVYTFSVCTPTPKRNESKQSKHTKHVKILTSKNIHFFFCRTKDMAQGEYTRGQVCYEKLDCDGTRIEKRSGCWALRLEGDVVAKSTRWPSFAAEPRFGGDKVTFKVHLRTLIVQHLLIV